MINFYTNDEIFCPFVNTYINISKCGRCNYYSHINIDKKYIECDYYRNKHMKFLYKDISPLDIPLPKPPLGLTPRFIIEEKRIFEIVEAISRYINVEKEIPIEWIEEYNELVNKQSNGKCK